MAQSFVRELLRTLVTLILAAASLMVAAPMAVLGAVALAGQLAHGDYREQAAIGLGLIGVAIIIWTISGAWLAWCGNRLQRWRFSTRSLLIALTLVAGYLGLIVWLTR